MAKFNFRLESVLKLREFKEEKVKNELAAIVKEITLVKQNIEDIHQAIDEGYDSQDKLLESPSLARNVSFYSSFLKGKRADLVQQEALLYALNKKYDRKVQDLAQAKADVKLINNIKEKKLSEFKKELTKKYEQQVDEFVAMKHFQKTKEG